MSATFKIIKSRVGEGGQTNGIEVKRIQQLLKLADYDPGPINGVWDDKTKKALTDFQEELDWGKVNPYIEPADANFRLFTLAFEAGVLLEMPNNKRSKSAALMLFQTCRDEKIPYGHGSDGGGSRMIWGMDGMPDYAVATTSTEYGPAEFDLRVPLSLNCTSFANVMLSVWIQGNVHSTPYNPSQGVGGFNPLAARYSLPPAPGFYVLDPPGVYKSVAQIEDATDPGRMYCISICDNRGYIWHDMVLIDGTVYECNHFNGHNGVFCTPLSEKIKQLQKGHYFTLYGPGPH